MHPPVYQPLPSAVAAFHDQPAQRRPWSTGLYDCDCGNEECCITCFCPCVTFGRIAEIVDQGSISSSASAVLYTLMCATGFLLPLYSCVYRYKLRQLYGLREEPCADCCVHCWCGCCSLCQMYRELRRRDFDMTIGWRDNMERRRALVATAPPAQQKMNP